MSEELPTGQPLVPTPVPSPAAAPPGGLALLVGTFWQPGATFKALGERPAFLWPLLILVIVAMLTQVVLLPRLDMEGTIREGMERFGQGDKLTDEQIHEMATRGGTLRKVAPLFGALLGIPIITALLALAYMLGLKVAGSSAGFDRAFAVVAHAQAPPAIVKTALTAVIALQRESFTAMEAERLVRSNLATWLGPEAPKALLALGGVLDVFNVWYWVLLVLGLAIVGRVTRGAAVGIVLVLWGLYTLGAVGLALLF